jgi:hypothetical protein
MSSKALLTLVLASAIACPIGSAGPARVTEATAVAQDSEVAGPADARITLTGVRLTKGDAVECPQIRDDSGAVHAVSYLSPRIAIGARVSVSGFYAVTTTCLGRVLVVEQERILEN